VTQPAHNKMYKKKRGVSKVKVILTNLAWQRGTIK